MAGAGARLFPENSKLTSAQVNTYLMDQTIMRFATTTDRDAAFGGAGEPTLAEGMTCYIDADNSLYSYTGTAWVIVSSPYITYTPTITGLGNGTASFTWTQKHKTVHFRGTVVFGSTSTVMQDITLPVAASSQYGFLDDFGSCLARDVSANQYYRMNYVFINATTVRLLYSGGIGGGAINGLFDISATAPFTWTTGDFFPFNIVYAAA